MKDKIVEEVLNKIEREYKSNPLQSVVAHGLYTINRIRREVKEMVTLQEKLK